MKAIVLQKEKDFQSLVLQEVPDPIPAPGEALVKIEAAALNKRDIWIIKGKYPNIKVPVILGSDGAGVVVEVGDQTDKKWVNKSVVINPGIDWGDNPKVQQNTYQILGTPRNGTNAEYIVVPIQNLQEKPANLTFEKCAAISLAGLTGYRALFTQGNLQFDQTVLITGIGGGVATLMLQMAVAKKAQVYVTSSSEEKIDMAIRLGAAGGANYKTEKWDRELASIAGESGIDLIVDGAGGQGFIRLISLVKPGGKIVSYGATAGKPSDMNLYKLFWKQVTIQGTTMGSNQDFQEMIQYFSGLEISPLIHKKYSLGDFRSAYLELMDEKQFGKIVLVP
jgi:NADPH:quinone reductase-like Zn-dependent oxidoreductase